MELSHFLLVLIVALAAAISLTTVPSEAAEFVEEKPFFKKKLPKFDYPKPYHYHHPLFKKPVDPFHHKPLIKPLPKKVYPKFKYPKYGHYHPGHPPVEKP